MSTNGKPKFAMYWGCSCGGCEIAVLNIHEKILDVDANFDIAFWPVAMDAKYKDVEALEDGAILLTLFNGGIRTVYPGWLISPASRTCLIRCTPHHPPITRMASDRSMTTKCQRAPCISPSFITC
jgi:hypothetical protein